MEPSFVARTFSGDVKHMTSVIQSGLQHQGFSFIEILQSCPTYNKATPHEWYQERVYDVTTLSEYDPSDLKNALNVAEDLEEKIALGVIYRRKGEPTPLQPPNRMAVTTELVDEVQMYSVRNLLAAFR